MFWLSWTVSVLFLVTWTLLWWQTRRVRMWFALLAPVGALGGAVLGVVLMLTGAHDGSCFGRNCRGDVGHFTESLDANAGLAGILLANSVLAFLTGVVLAFLTLVVETTRMVRRSEAAQRDNSSV